MKHRMKEKFWNICCCSCSFGWWMLLLCTCQVNILATQVWERMELLTCQCLRLFTSDKQIFTLHTNFHMQSIGKSLAEWGSRIKVAILLKILFPSITLKNAYVNLDQQSPYRELWLHEIEISLLPSVCGKTKSSVMSRDCSWKWKWTFLGHMCEVQGFWVMIFVLRFYFENSSTIKIEGESETISFFIFLK